MKRLFGLAAFLMLAAVPAFLSAAGFDGKYLEAYVGTSPYVNLNSTSPGWRYQWQELEDGSEWADIDGAISQTLRFYKVGLSDNGRVFRCLIDKGGSLSQTESVMLLVAEKPRTLKPSAVQNAYTGGASELSVPYVEGYFYRWEVYDAKARAWKKIPGAESNTLRIENLDLGQNGEKYRCLYTPFESMSEWIVSGAVSLKVWESARITEDPKGATLEEGKTAKFSVKAAGRSVKYQWEKRHAGGTWEDIPRATGASYSISKLSKERDDGLELRCRVYNDGGGDCSEAAGLSVVVAAKILSVSGNAVVFEGVPAVFSVAANVEPPALYLWQYRLPKSKIWEDVPDGADAEIAVSGYPDGTVFRCSVSSGSGGKVLVSKEMKLSVWAKGSVSILEPRPQAFEGGKAAMKAKAAGVGSFKYRWMKSENGGAWEEIPRATGTSYTTPPLSGADFDAEYKCVATNAAGPVESLPVKVLRLAPAKVKTHPVDQECAADGEARFFVEAREDAGSAVKYRWESSLDGGLTWKPAGSSKSELVVKKPKAALNGAMYRCGVYNVANKASPDFSLPARLHVKAPAFISVHPKAQTSYAGSMAYFSADSPNATRWQWQISLNGGRDWTDIDGETAPGLLFDYAAWGLGGYLKGVGKYSIRCLVGNGDAPGWTVSKAASNTAYEKVSVIALYCQPKNGPKEALVRDDPVCGVSAGTEVALSAEASGYSPKFQWFKWNASAGRYEALKGATKASYKFILEDAGVSAPVSFKCFVYNGQVKPADEGTYGKGTHDSFEVDFYPAD